MQKGRDKFMRIQAKVPLLEKLDCQHYWQLTAPNHDGVVFAKCRKCQAERLLPGREDMLVDTTIVGGPAKVPAVANAHIRVRCNELNSRKAEIVAAWEGCGHNIRVTADKLHIPVPTLYGKLYQWGLKRRPKERTSLADEISSLLREKKAKLERREDRMERDKLEADILALVRVRELIRSVP